MLSKNRAAALLTWAIVGILVPQAFGQAAWEGSAGALFLNRDANYQGNVVIDNAHNPLITSGNFETGFHGGFHTAATRHLNDTHSVVARYFSIDDWTEMASTTSTNGAWLYGGVVGAPTISQINGIFASDLNSFEISLAHQHHAWLRLMAGFRWLSIDETIHVDFFQGMTDYADYDAFVKNDLYGGRSLRNGCALHWRVREWCSEPDRGFDRQDVLRWRDWHQRQPAAHG